MYPVAYSAPLDAEGRSRLTVFFRGLLAIPWFIVAALWGIAVNFTVLFAWFALLFTGRYPDGLYEFNARYLRFNARVHSWYYLLTDEWPPFSGDPDQPYPIRLAIAEPKAEYSRAKVFFRLILMIPVVIVGYLMALILSVFGFIAWFALLFTARLPEGLYKPMRAASAYVIKAGAFYMLLTEDFPPFWVEEQEETPAFAGAGAAPLDPPPPAPPAASA